MACSCTTDSPCRNHGPCKPWCTVEDIVEVRDPNGNCDKNGILALVERLNLANPEHGDETFNYFGVIASSILFRLSGEQFPGICRSAIHYTDRGVECTGWPLDSSAARYWPSYVYDPLIGAFTHGPGLDPRREMWEFGDRLVLPYTPVCSVEAVIIPDIWDGVKPLLVQDTATGAPETEAPDFLTRPLLKSDGTAYEPGDTYPLVIPTDDVRIVDGRYLVRCDGETWDIPTPMLCQDPPSLSIIFSHGYAPPPEGVAAACELAGELMKLKLTGTCRLPERTRSASRGGVSFTLMDPMEFLKEGKTGLYFPDLFLHTWNPFGHTETPIVAWPQHKGRGRRTFTVRNL